MKAMGHGERGHGDRLGMTTPQLAAWPPTDPAYRRSEVSAPIGAGEALWMRASADLLRWRVKTASGFRVASSPPSASAAPVSPGRRLTITAGLLGITVTEPVEVVAVVEERDRVGFAYRTLPGHPVSGEEAFILHRDGAEIRLTVRSLTRAAPQQPWRMLYPLLRVAQRVARRRYLRALR